MPADFGDGFASERPDGTRRIPLGLESGVALPLKLLCEEPALGTAISLGDGQDSACKMLPRSTETDGGEIARGSGAPRNTVPRWGPRKACGRLLTPAVGAWSPRWAASDLFFAGSATTERQHAEDTLTLGQQAGALEKDGQGARPCASHHLHPPHKIQAIHASTSSAITSHSVRRGRRPSSSRCGACGVFESC